MDRATTGGQAEAAGRLSIAALTHRRPITRHSRSRLVLALSAPGWLIGALAGAGLEPLGWAPANGGRAIERRGLHNVLQVAERHARLFPEWGLACAIYAVALSWGARRRVCHLREVPLARLHHQRLAGYPMQALPLACWGGGEASRRPVAPLGPFRPVRQRWITVIELSISNSGGRRRSGKPCTLR